MILRDLAQKLPEGLECGSVCQGTCFSTVMSNSGQLAKCHTEIYINRKLVKSNELYPCNGPRCVCLKVLYVLK